VVFYFSSACCGVVHLNKIEGYKWYDG